jgi:phosphoglycerate kinase
MRKKILSDLQLRGKRVLMRVDFNVPLAKDGALSDDTRIRASLASIQYVLKEGGRPILMSHLGRPKGVDSSLSLCNVARRLSELTKREVLFAKDCVGPKAEAVVQKQKEGQIVLLENLRFHEGEEEPSKDPEFVKLLAKLGDCYVNDAFGTAHRAHASTTLIAAYFPGQAAAGFLMAKEMEQLSPFVHCPVHPFFAILGGAKVSTKIGVIQALSTKVDALFIGGAMAFTFLKAQGVEMGESPVEEAQIENARQMLVTCGKKLILPSDLIIANAFTNEALTRQIDAFQGIPPGWRGMDIGHETVGAWSSRLREGAAIFWNGPLGVCEMPQFAQGTRGVAELLSTMGDKVVVGGGDSVAAIEQMGLGPSFAHLSTGGGASLEFLEQGHLPGVDALSDI